MPHRIAVRRRLIFAVRKAWIEMKIGFIGTGNMGSAIIEGIVKNHLSDKVAAFDKNEKALADLAKRLGIVPLKDEKSVAENCDILFLAVKPNVVYDVIAKIKSVVSENIVIVSIVAGQSIEKLENAFGKSIKLVRVMPNTPALVGESMAALCKNATADEGDIEAVAKIFNCLGKAEIVSEYMMDAVTAVSGSSPAYVFMMIEAMADAAVMGGIPRQKAYTFAAQAVLGSAKMVLETGMHPGELKDMVCSPAGTTIEAVKVLEECGFRSAIIDAMQACMDKSKDM